MIDETLKVVRIGNSRGVRLPLLLLERYRIKTKVIVERRADGILLKPARDDRLSWEDTAKAMAGEQAAQSAEFSDFDATNGDGLGSLDR